MLGWNVANAAPGVHYSLNGRKSSASGRHSGAMREHRTRNPGIPGLIQRIIGE
jgi:hypothetical protein